MTDERYVFTQDVKERSQMKTGAMHKKNGSKSKKCTFPSDHLTPKQKQKLNGSCESIKLNEPCHDWEKFKKLSKETKAEYIHNLVNNYGARRSDVAEMFGVQPIALTNYLYSAGIRANFPRGKNLPKEMDERFMDFITAPEEKVEAVSKKTDEEILKERFDIDIPVKEEPEETGEPKQANVATAILDGEPLKQADYSEYARVFDKEPAKMGIFETKSSEDIAKESGAVDAIYLKSFYDKCLELGFGEVLTQTLTIERSKKIMVCV